MRSRWRTIFALALAVAVLANISGLKGKDVFGVRAGAPSWKAAPEPAASPGVNLPPFVGPPGGWRKGEGIDVRDFLARGDGQTDDSAAIQKAIDSLGGGGTVYFPKATYVAKNVFLRPGVTLDFEPGAVLKFPPGSKGTDRMIIVGEIDGAKFREADKGKEYRIIGNGLTIDATGLSANHTCYGIFVSGAANFFVADVQGHGFQNGYLVEIIRSYGAREEYPRNGHVRNIRNFGPGWGCVAVETGVDLVIEDIYSDTNGVNIECDVDVMGHGVLAVRNVEIRNVVTSGGFTVNINAHEAMIENVRVANIRNTRGTLLGLYTYTVPELAGSVKNVTIENGFGDGGGVAENGIESPNDTVVENLVVRNVTVVNYRSFGVKTNGGDWYNCRAANNGLSGWKSTAQPGTLVPIARFFACEAIDNNSRGIINHSGWNYANHSWLEFYDCRGTDTRSPKRQWYAVFTDAAVVMRDCRFDGNRTADIAPIAKIKPFD